LNETNYFEVRTSQTSREILDEKEKETDEAFCELFSLIISPEDHCVICDTNISALDMTVSLALKVFFSNHTSVLRKEKRTLTNASIRKRRPDQLTQKNFCV